MKGIETILQDTKVDKINIFGYEIIKCKIPEYVYDQKSLEESINGVFNSNIVITQGNNSLEQNGEAYSTCSLGNRVVQDLNGVDFLLNCISINILNNFYGIIKNKKILYHRMWMNKMFKNCSGSCHAHNGIADGTAVFYYNVPENGSQLIILKHDIGGIVTKEHSEISHYIKVETGDLIIHDKLIPHAVSKHMSNEPRICFVFDFLLEKSNSTYVNYR